MKYFVLTVAMFFELWWFSHCIVHLYWHGFFRILSNFCLMACVSSIIVLIAAHVYYGLEED